MSFPVYVRLPGVAVHPHVFFDVLAYVCGSWSLMVAMRRGADVVDARTRWMLSAAAVAGGVLGSHLLFALEVPADLPSMFAEPSRFLEGKTIIGGLVGGLAAVELVKAWAAVSIATGDAMVVPLATGIAIGRVGCFLTGLSDGTAGVGTTLPWGVDFGDGVPRHPTPLYEAVFVVGLGAMAARLSARMQPGDAFKMFLVGYLGFRFMVDFLKPAVRIAGVSALQWVCLAVLAYYAPHVRRLLKESRHD